MCAITSVHEMAFIPRKLFTVQVGHYLVNVYPKVEPSMPVYERTHAFQVACTALEPLPVNRCLILDVLGAQLNCSAIVDGQVFNWLNRFDKHWFNFANLVIQLFHNLAGIELKTTATAADPTVLLPMQNGSPANCRKADVCFVCVQCSIDFLPLVTITNPGPSVLRAQFCIELPQTTVALSSTRPVPIIT
jgi:hypothetical protein